MEINQLNLNRSLFQITTGKKHRVCGNGFMIFTEPGKGLAFTPFSSRIAPNGRDTNLYSRARFENGFSSRLVYCADNPRINISLAELDARGIEKMAAPVHLSFKLPAEGAQITCVQPNGSFPTEFRKSIETSSEPNQFMFGAMAPADYIGGAVVHEDKVIGLVTRPFYASPSAEIIGMTGGTSIRTIFDFLIRGAQGSVVHPDGFKYNLDPKITAIINQIAEALSAA